MAYHGWRVVFKRCCLCLLLALASSVCATTRYVVEWRAYWPLGPYSGTIVAGQGVTADAAALAALNKICQGKEAVSYGGGYAAGYHCPHSLWPVGPSNGHLDSFAADVLVSSKDNWFFFGVGVGYPLTYYINRTMYNCEKCVKGDGYNTYTGAPRYTYQVSTDVVPEWVLNGQNVNMPNPQLTVENGQVVGFGTGTLVPPVGGYEGEGGTGHWVMDPVTGPQWVWNEPPGEGSDTNAVAFNGWVHVYDFSKLLVDVEGLAVSADRSVAFAETIDGSLIEVNSGLAALSAVITSAFGDEALLLSGMSDKLSALGVSTAGLRGDVVSVGNGILARIDSHGSIVVGALDSMKASLLASGEANRLQIDNEGNAIVASVNGVTTRVGQLSGDLQSVESAVSSGFTGANMIAQNVRSSVDGLKPELVGIHYDTSRANDKLGDMYALQDNILGELEIMHVDLMGKENAGLDPVDFSGDFQHGNYTPLGPVVPYVPVDIPADSSVFDNIFLTLQGKISVLNYYFENIFDYITFYANALVGSWKNLGSTPHANLSIDCLDYHCELDMTMFNNFWRAVRPFEVVCVWILFLFAVMRMISAAFGGN